MSRESQRSQRSQTSRKSRCLSWKADLRKAVGRCWPGQIQGMGALGCALRLLNTLLFLGAVLLASTVDAQAAGLEYRAVDLPLGGVLKRPAKAPATVKVGAVTAASNSFCSNDRLARQGCADAVVFLGRWLSGVESKILHVGGRPFGRRCDQLGV